MNEIDAEDLAAFLVESHEILAQFEQDVLHLESNSLDLERLNQLYRALHTIKGNCGFIPFPKLEALAHAGETLLDLLRSAQRQISPEILTVLLDLTDVMRQLLQQIETTQSEGDQDYSSLVAALLALCTVEVTDGTLVNGTLANTSTSTSTSTNSTNGFNPKILEASSSKTLTPLDTTIRVEVERLDHLMDLVSELVLARNRVLQLTATTSHPALISTCQQIDRITNKLQDSVMHTRLQPISRLWRSLPRLVRDLAMGYGKEVVLTLEGGETELDRSIMAAIKDPLTHLIRNGIDHGIEATALRRAAGKPVQGNITLKAYQESGKILIEISDDGAGIDPNHIRTKAQKLGFISAAQAEALSDRAALDLIFLPGFSTAAAVTHLSGRGVGMDVVRQNLETVNGTVEVESQLGRGTTFRLNIPLTLTIMPTLLVMSGGERFAIPQASVQELIRIEGEQIEQDIETLLDAPIYRLRGQMLPLVHLASLLQLSNSSLNSFLNNSLYDSINNPPGHSDEDISTSVLYFVVVAADGYQFGLGVDSIEDTQNIVVKPLSKQLKSLPVFAGTTVLGDGNAALILDAARLARYAGLQRQPPITSIAAEPEDRPLILMVLGPENTRMGIVLNQATRLEIIASNRIEQVGAQYLLQYREGVVTLIDLQAVLTGTPRRLDQFEAFISLVVIRLKPEHTVGLIVNQILDIVEESMTITGAATRPGSRCYAAVQGQITEILDLEAIVELANPYRISQLIATTRR